jgi:hypothetical protein
MGNNGKHNINITALLSFKDMALHLVVASLYSTNTAIVDGSRKHPCAHSSDDISYLRTNDYSTSRKFVIKIKQLKSERRQPCSYS